MRCAEPFKQMPARLGALTAAVGKKTRDVLNGANAPVAADDTEEKPT